MKKYFKMFLIIFIFFIYTNSVLAKTLVKTCQFNNYDNSLSANSAVTIYLYDNNTSQAVITQADGKNVNNSESIQNWNDIKGNISSSYNCPTHIVMTYGGIVGANVWAYFDRDEAINKATAEKAIFMSGQEYKNNNDDEYNKVLERIKNVSLLCQKNAETKFDPESCIDNGKLTTKYNECINNAKSVNSQVRSTLQEIEGYGATYTNLKSDETYTSVKSDCEKAVDNTQKYLDALEYMSSVEYSEKMGTPTSHDESEIAGNEYLEDWTNIKVEGDGIDSSFLKICDKNQNPEILAVFRLAGILLMIVKIVVPLLLILFGMIDLSKAVIDSKDDAIKTSTIKFGKRVALGLIIFFVPSIISGLFTILTDYSSFIKEFEPCMNCILNPNGDDCPKTSFTK